MTSSLPTSRADANGDACENQHRDAKPDTSPVPLVLHENKIGRSDGKMTETDI